MLASSTSLSSSSLLRRIRDDDDLGKPSTCHIAAGQRNVRGKEELSRRRRRIRGGGGTAVKAVLKCRASKLSAFRSEDNNSGRKITRGIVSLSSADGVRGIGANASKNESPSSDKEEEEEEEDRASKENDTNKIPSDVLNSFSVVR